jgi:uncharacterized membrane protein YkoI
MYRFFNMDKGILTRRSLLAMLSSVALSMIAVDCASAKDGDSGGGSGGSGGGGDDGGGDDGDRSDKDNDGDDKNKDDDDDDEDDDGNSGKGSRQLDPDKIREAVKSGRAMPLSQALNIVSQAGLGRVIDVKLVEKGNKLNYRFKVITRVGRVKSISMDAKGGGVPKFFGL